MGKAFLFNSLLFHWLQIVFHFILSKSTNIMKTWKHFSVHFPAHVLQASLSQNNTYMGAFYFNIHIEINGLI